MAAKLIQNYLPHKRRQGAREKLELDLKKHGIPEECHEELIEAMLEANEVDVQQEGASPFWGKQTLMACAIAGVLVLGSAMTVASQKVPEAKIPNYSGMFATITMLAGDFLHCYIKSKPFSLERSVIGRVAGTYIMLLVIAAIKEMPEQLGLGEKNPARELLMGLYGLIISNVTDGVRNILQQLMGNLPNFYLHDILPEDLTSANFATGLDFLGYLILQIVSRRNENRVDPVDEEAAPRRRSPAPAVLTSNRKPVRVAALASSSSSDTALPIAPLLRWDSNTVVPHVPVLKSASAPVEHTEVAASLLAESSDADAGLLADAAVGQDEPSVKDGKKVAMPTKPLAETSVTPTQSPAEGPDRAG